MAVCYRVLLAEEETLSLRSSYEEDGNENIPDSFPSRVAFARM